jgi:3-hydroxyisobutyrate dehydrogenase-like beta-hydroxyacid dehydrogenase
MLKKRSQVVVIGCGLMGSAIAKALSASGINVVAWNRSPDAVEQLAEFGVTPERSLEVAIHSSSCVVVVLGNYDICSSVLYPHQSLLRGKLVVNLSSGTCEQADEFGRWIRGVKADYLDGSIWALPKGIGEPGTCLSYSGSRSAFERWYPVLKVLGGATRYVSERFGAANALEAAFPGTFYMTAILSFIEGVALCRAYEISEEVVLDSIDPTMELLRNSLLQTMQKVSIKDYSTNQATLRVFHDAVASYQRNTLSPVKDSPLSTALRQTLEQACSTGMRDQDVAATINRWGIPQLTSNTSSPVA